MDLRSSLLKRTCQDWVVCGILDKDANEMYLIKWEDSSTSWEHRSNLDGCLELLEEFLKVSSIIDEIKTKALPPSSRCLTVDMVLSLAGIGGILAGWQPRTKTFTQQEDVEVKFSAHLKDRKKLVDSSKTEIGLYPAIESVLLDGILNSGRTDLFIVPRKSLSPPGPTNASVDFSISIVSTIIGLPMVPSILVEVKQNVPLTLVNVDYAHLVGQVFIQAYYALCQHPKLNSLIVSLSDTEVYHFFKVTLASTPEENKPFKIINVDWAVSESSKDRVINILSDCLKANDVNN